MVWIYLLCAIGFEVVATMSLKQIAISGGYVWGAVATIGYICSFTFLVFAIKKIEIGAAYAIWSGVGTALVALLGWIIFKESMNLTKIIALFFIILGVVMLKYQSA